MPGWINPLLGFFLIVLLAVVLVYFFLDREVASLQGKIEDLDIEIASLRTPAVNKLEKEMKALSEGITRFTELFEKRQLTADVFGFFSEICHPRVQFRDFDLSVKDATLSLTGVADNFRVLGEQILILQHEERIQQLQMSGVVLTDEGFVEFKLSIKLADDFFDKTLNNPKQ